ncbi:MAG: glycosyltransferase family 1 protein [Patescibacteria group bacterium]
MKIGIDARMLGSKQGGIGRYIEQLVREFANEQHTPAPLQRGGDFEFVVFLRKENWDLVAETPNIKKVMADIPWYGWREQLLLPEIIKREKVDLMHFPHWNIPLFYKGKFIVTIHDLLLLHYPTRAASTLGPISYFFKSIAHKIILRHAIYYSKKIIAPSEFTKNDILKNFKVKPEKIIVTLLAPMPAITQMADIDLKIQYKITKPYILYVGVAYPHKNLEGLLEAWKIFCADHGNIYQLVLAGRKNFFYERLEKMAENIDGVIFTGFVPDDDLPTLYQHASLYVFPSFYEGFGLPPLEAMTYGVPVTSSNTTCLPEILGQAAAYFDPRDPSDMADTIWRCLIDSELRATLNKNGTQLIHNYSWKNTARATLDVYINVV